VPCSKYCRKISCCTRLNRCISSRNSIVFLEFELLGKVVSYDAFSYLPVRAFVPLASSMTFLTSATPDDVALSSFRTLPEYFAISLARVVFPVRHSWRMAKPTQKALPHPGGPHKTTLPSLPAFRSDPNAELGPTMWDWPTNSSRSAGRSRSASGVASTVSRRGRLDGPTEEMKGRS
jgi:hypothetical protein